MVGPGFLYRVLYSPYKGILQLTEHEVRTFGVHSYYLRVLCQSTMITVAMSLCLIEFSPLFQNHLTLVTHLY